MRADPEKCLNDCGRYRPNDLDSPSPNLESDGTFMGLPYWFCSVECYKKMVRKFIKDPRYDFDSKPEDDEDFIAEVQRIHEEYRDRSGSPGIQTLFNPVAWQSEDKYCAPTIQRAFESFQLSKQAAITAAEIELSYRLDAEWEHQRAEENAAHEKIAAKQNAEILKLVTQQKEREAKEEAIQEMLEEKPIPFEYRFDHTHILGSSGHGKTTLLIKQFLEDIENPRRPALVVIDPKGTLVERLRRHAAFNPKNTRIISSNTYHEGFKNPEVLAERLVIIDPSLFPPALNIFAPPKRVYSQNIAQQIENNTISLFQYMFGSKDSALTDKQLTCFSFGVSLVLSIPNATLRTFFKLLKDPHVSKVGGLRPDSPFKPYIDKLDDTARSFFYDYFYDPTEYAGTKDQIAARIYGLLRYKAFDSMFSTPENKLDMFDCLQKGRIVLVSSPKSVLSTEGSKLFSRYMVAITLQAAFERKVAYPNQRNKWRPAFLVIDEAQDVMDEVKTRELLEQAREFRLGVTFAHHEIDGQLSPKLFSGLSANTRIKYAGTRSYQDARTMALDMRCAPEFILDRKLQPTTTSFACSVGGLTEHPFVLEIDLSINEFPTYDDQWVEVAEDLQSHQYGVTKKDSTETQTAPKLVAAATDLPIVTHEGPTEAEPSRAKNIHPAEADKEIVPETKRDAKKKWTLD